MTATGNLLHVEVQLACRNSNADAISCTLTHQRTANGRLIGDLHVQRICLVRADDAVGQLLVLILVIEANHGAQADGALVHSALVNDLGILNQIFQFLNACLNLGLLVAGLIVLGVLGKVTESACDGNLLLDLLTTGELKIFQLVNQFLIALLGIHLLDVLCHDMASFKFLV